MSREIKFRGKSIGIGEWIYGYLFNYGGIVRSRNMLCICHCIPERKDAYNIYSVDPSTIGQYTGLKDKNYKKIFDGDILYQDGNILGVVCFSLRYGISIQKQSSTWALRNFVLDSDFDTKVLTDIEVKGNIHDNPELMKG